MNEKFNRTNSSEGDNNKDFIKQATTLRDRILAGKTTTNDKQNLHELAIQAESIKSNSGTLTTDFDLVEYILTANKTINGIAEVNHEDKQYAEGLNDIVKALGPDGAISFDHYITIEQIQNGVDVVEKQFNKKNIDIHFLANFIKELKYRAIIVLQQIDISNDKVREKYASLNLKINNLSDKIFAQINNIEL
jgi:hypothetical protein